MRISQLAERSGVSATTLRYYEGAGLLPAERASSGYRLYGEEAVERLAFISTAKRLGLPLEEIAELLPLWESGACADVKADLRPRLAARVRDAQVRQAEVAAFTTALRRALQHLDALPDRSGSCDPAYGFLTPEPAKSGPAHRPLTPGPAHAEPGKERGQTVPVACSLTGDGQGARTDQWRQLLGGAEQQEIPEGLLLTLPVERAVEITALAIAEQQCCPFFDFRLRLEGPVLHLEVRAPAEGAGLLAELFMSSA